MTRSPGAADGLFSRPLMLITAITYRFFAPLLSAQFITADMGRPSVMRSLLPSPGGLLFPPMVAARGGGGAGASLACVGDGVMAGRVLPK